jgi:hypothetical protein
MIPDEDSGANKASGGGTPDREDRGDAAGEAVAWIGMTGGVGLLGAAAEPTTSVEELTTQAKPSTEVNFTSFKGQGGEETALLNQNKTIEIKKK